MAEIHGELPTIFDRRRPEQLVRDQVVAQTFADLPAPSVRQRLEASHYQLVTRASPLAFAAVWRHSTGSISDADLRAGARHHTRFGS